MLTYLGYRFIELLAFILPYPIAYFVASSGYFLAFKLGISVGYIKKNASVVLKKDINDPLSKYIMVTSLLKSCNLNEKDIEREVLLC